MNARHCQLDPIGPPIEPIAAADTTRPQWSVMIPTFNCARYLRETLASVLEQAGSPGEMQIEVVDDCSTSDDPEAVVRAVGQGQVAFYRHEQNVGISRNFNACIRRARGRLVHILHGDDAVCPGFYRAVEALAQQCPQAALLATETVEMDEDGEPRAHRTPLELPASQLFAAETMYYQNPLRTPGVVIRRSFYERWGGFLESLSHVADWEMWLRAAALEGGALLAAPLAKYRLFSASDTSRLMRTAGNLREYLRLAEIVAQRHPDFDPERFRRSTGKLARRQAKRFAQRGDWPAYEANCELALELVTAPRRYWQWIESVGWRLWYRPHSETAATEGLSSSGAVAP